MWALPAGTDLTDLSAINSAIQAAVRPYGVIGVGVVSEARSVTNTSTLTDFSTITGTPTTLAGYGITDAISSGSTALTIVGDDSTGAGLNISETFKIAGTQNVTTAVSGDTLTITGPDLSSYATTSYVDAQNQSQTLTFVGDDSTGTAVNSGETFKIAGTQNITTAVSGDTLTITGPDLSSYLTTVAFADLTSKPTTLSGYGITDAVASDSTAVTMVGDDSTGTGVNIGETFKIAGTQNITTAVSGDTLTITGPDLTNYLNSTQISVSGNKISTTESNANIELDPNGTGDVIVNSGDILPATDNTQYLGSASKRWHTVYVGPGSINLGGAVISNTGGVVALPGVNTVGYRPSSLDDGAGGSITYPLEESGSPLTFTDVPVMPRRRSQRPTLTTSSVT